MENLPKIECYSCQNDISVRSSFNGVVCPEGWTIDENPCKNNTTDSYITPKGKKIKLKKTSYKYKDVIDLLDLKISEFNNEPLSVPNFFDLYNTNFYELRKNLHNNLIVESEKHIGSVINPREAEIQNTKEDIERIQLEIDSVEREHSYFTNGTFLMHSDFSQAHTGGSGDTTTGNPIIGPKYFMQSGKKRKIIDDYEVFSKIKNRFGIKNIPDIDIIIFLGPGGLGAIQTGPPINTMGDVFKSSYEVNMYTP
mgnify:CR=1 FL=1